MKFVQVMWGHLWRVGSLFTSLDKSDRICFWVINSGLIIYALYISVHYSSMWINNDFHGVQHSKVLNGSGTPISQLIFALHLITGCIALVLGGLLLSRRIRTYLESWHRLTGYTYMISVVLLSASGLWLTWGISPPQSPTNAVGTSINALLMVWFSIATISYAVQKQWEQHHIWAIRLYLMVLSAWFLRISFKLWGVFSGGDNQFFSVYFTFMHYGQFILPLLAYEIYRWLKSKPLVLFRATALCLIWPIIIVLAVGIYRAANDMWLARIL